MIAHLEVATAALRDVAPANVRVGSTAAVASTLALGPLHLRLLTLVERFSASGPCHEATSLELADELFGCVASRLYV